MNTLPLTAQSVDGNRWDDYVSQHPQGHHEQSSQFATMRSKNGFKSIRIAIVSSKNEILGGAQVLFREVPVAGRLAFITQGPLVSDARPDVAEVMVRTLDTIAREHRLARLRIINYSADDFWEPLLVQSGFARSGYRWGTGETQVIRCDDNDDVLLARMQSTCRYNVRLAYRKGVSVKAASNADDVTTFYRLLDQTAQRQNFEIFPLDYFQYIWKLFSRHNKLRLILAYADGEPLAGVIATVCGDRVYDGWAGMSPNRTNLKANYVTHWEAIRWARSLGYKFYDFSGGEGSVYQFKRWWGGEPVLYPDPFDKYYGIIRTPRKYATQIAWDIKLLRELTRRIDYRLRGPMPF